MKIPGYRLDPAQGEVETPLGRLLRARAEGGGAPPKAGQAAILVIPAALCDRSRGLDALRALKSTLATAQIPWIPPLRDCGRLPSGALYVVTEALPEVSLASLQRDHSGRLPTREAQPLLLQAARALAAAQQHGLSHLLLRPEHLRAGPLGCLIFYMGLWRALDPQKLPGLRRPHPREDSQTLGAADVYDLGALFYEAITGKPLAPDETTTGEPPPTLARLLPGVPIRLSALIAAMLAPDPLARPTPREVVLLLTPKEATEPTLASGATGATAAAAPAASADEGLATARTQAGIGDAAPGEAGAVRTDARTAAGDAAAADADGEVSPSAMTPRSPVSPQLYGNYRVVSKIGEGGMGVVYAAIHHQIGRWAAVKVLHPIYAQSKEFAARFLNEARAVNIVHHPGMVEIFEFGQRPDGSLYIIMELLEGETLRGHFEARGYLKERAALPVLLQMARALIAAHEKGIVHRDLKPENVMLVPDPVHPGTQRVKILDFGIAKVGEPPSAGEEGGSTVRTETEASMGTPRYMAPEQHGAAAEVTDRADVFSLGVMIYELLGGEPPFARSALSLIAKPVRPLREVRAQVSREMEALVGRMMSPDPAARPPMTEVAAALSAMLKAAEEAERPRPPVRRAVLWGALCAAAVLVPAVSLITVRTTRRNQERKAAVDLNALRRRALPVFEQGLREGDPAQRAFALGTLGQCRDLRLRPLIEPLVFDPAPAVAAAAAEWLGQLGAPESLPALLKASDGARGQVGLAVAGALTWLQHPRGPALLREALLEPDDSTRLFAALTLSEHGDPEALASLREWLKRRNLPGDATLRILSALSRTGDAQAQEQLLALLSSERHSLMGLSLASSLARLGDDRGRAHLLEQARRPGPQRLLSARLLAALGDAMGQPFFEEVFADRGQAVPARLLAAEGLAAIGKGEGALTLATALPEAGRPGAGPGASGGKDAVEPALRQAAAGGILQIAGNDSSAIADQSLIWARAALGQGAPPVRESAVGVLGEVDTAEALPLLSQALRDSEKSVRHRAARALGNKRAREAVLALRDALSDSDEEVRRAAMGSIARVVEALRQRGDTEGGAPVKARLKELAQGGSPADRIVASGTLLRLGDSSRRQVLEEALAGADPLLRQLAVEMAGQDEALLERALADSDPGVRLLAARRLAARGVRKGVPILRDAFNEGGGPGRGADALLSYCALKRLGEPVSPPAGLFGVLAGANLALRLQVMEAALDLPAGEALPLLLRALLDPAAEVRMRAADLAAAMAGAAGVSSRARGALRTLVSDPDLGVRTRAAALLSHLPRTEEAYAGSELADLGPGADMGLDGGGDGGGASDAGLADAAADPYGHLQFQGEEKVRVQIDQKAPQSLPLRDVRLAPGAHRIRYLGGAQEVEVAAGETRVLHIPTSQAEQILDDGAQALVRGEHERARLLLDRAKLLLTRGAHRPALLVALSAHRGALYEAQSRWVEAVTEYNKVLKAPPGQRREEHAVTARAGLQRLQRRVGRIQIYKEVEGQCQMTELWVPPGEHVVDLGQGKSQAVSVSEGKTVTVRRCP